MRRIVAILLTSTIAACGSSSSDGTTDPTGTSGTTGPNLSGSYTLRTVDGKPVPAAIGDSTILSGLLTVADSTWNQIIVVRYGAGGSQGAAGDSLPLSGRLLVNGATVTFLESGATAYQGSFTSTSFSLTSKTSTFVFAK
jgi:hypothetical protein